VATKKPPTFSDETQPIVRNLHEPSVADPHDEDADTNVFEDQTTPHVRPRAVSGLASAEDRARDEKRRARKRATLGVLLERIAVICDELDELDDSRAPWLRDELRGLLERLGVPADVPRKRY
jgi:hypothetical protein